MGGWWRWVLVSPDGVVLSRLVSVSASVNLPLHHSLAPAHLSGPRKRAAERFWCGVVLSFYFSSPNLSGRRLDVYHTSTHGVALVRI